MYQKDILIYVKKYLHTHTHHTFSENGYFIQCFIGQPGEPVRGETHLLKYFGPERFFSE